jgi:hypothetical protein
MRAHPVKHQRNNRKKNYDWSKSTDNGDACGAAADSACPANKPDGRFWQSSATVNCYTCWPAKRSAPRGSAASSTARLQVAQASWRENSLIDCDED